ncbi:hypothetical protein ACFQ3Z_13730 [Streptomyces nogalater]
MVAGRGAAAVQGTAALAAAGLRRFPRRRHRCAVALRDRDRARRDRLRGRPDLRHAVLPPWLRLRLGGPAARPPGRWRRQQAAPGPGGPQGFRPAGHRPRDPGHRPRVPRHRPGDLRPRPGRLHPDQGGYTPGQDGYGSAQAPGDLDDDRDDVFTPAAARPAAAGTTAVHAPQPAPGDTGGYGAYGDPAYPAPDPGTPAYGYSGHGAQDYGYDTPTARRATPTTRTPTSAAGPTPPTTRAPPGRTGSSRTTPGPVRPRRLPRDPAGRVWVPQQRTDDSHGGELPQEQPYPRQPGGPGSGYDEQYRY